MPVDGVGKQVQAWSNVLGPGTLYTEAVTITDSTGIEKGTSGNPVRIDPTGTTVQPVSGTFWQTTQPVSIVAGTAVIGHVIVDSGTITTVSTLTTITNAVKVVGNAGQSFDAPTGNAAPGNAIQIGGQDPSLHLQAFAVSSGGVLYTGVGDGTNLVGTLTNFGTTPTAVKSLPVNASLFQGTTAVGSGAPLQVSLADTGSNSTPVNITPGTVSAQTGSWTSATSQNATVSVACAGYSAVEFSLSSTSTMTGGIITFEASDDGGTTWYGMIAIPMGGASAGAASGTQACFSLPSNPSIYLAYVAGCTNFRLRLSTVITGTGTVSVRVQASSIGAPQINSVGQFGLWTVSLTFAASQQASTVAVGGAVATNTALTSDTYPITIAGSDYGGTPKKQNWKVDSSGNGYVFNNVNQIAGSSVSTATTGVQKVGIVGNAGAAFDAATNAAPPANAIQIAGIAATALPSANTATDLTVPMTDKFGRAVVLTNAMRDIVGTQTTQIANSTSQTTIVTAVASTFLDITGFQITNATATAVTVTIKDSTSGTTRKVYDLAANGGIVVHFDPPLPQAAVNNNWTATLSATGITVDINVDYIQNK